MATQLAAQPADMESGHHDTPPIEASGFSRPPLGLQSAATSLQDAIATPEGRAHSLYKSTARSQRFGVRRQVSLRKEILHKPDSVHQILHAPPQPIQMDRAAFRALLSTSRPAFLSFEPAFCGMVCRATAQLWLQLAPEFPMLLFGMVPATVAIEAAALDKDESTMLDRTRSPLLKIRISARFDPYHGPLLLDDVREFLFERVTVILSQPLMTPAWIQRVRGRVSGGGSERVGKRTLPAPLQRRRRPLGDWIFVAHHKSGTTVGKTLTDALCHATGRPVFKYTYREQPMEPHKASGACHFLVKIYGEDVNMWLSFLHRSAYNRLVHFVRDPVKMVASGYLFHRRGSEIEWTNSTHCSRDLCTLPEKWGRRRSKRTVSPIFRAMSAKPWLQLYGCRQEHLTYYMCLNGLSVEEGLRVETARSLATLRTMVAFDEMARSAQTFSMQLDWLLPHVFNATTTRLVRWLRGEDADQANATHRVRALHAAEASAEAIAEKAFVACSSSPRVHKIATGFSPKVANAKVPPTQEALTLALRAWADDVEPPLRELAARSNMSTRRALPLFAGGQPQPWKNGTRGVVTCSSPNLIKATLLMVARLRSKGCQLPVELWHANEILADEAQAVQSTDELGLTVHDLADVISPSLPADELRALQGYMCKPLALLASTFDEIVLLDHDAHVFIDPATLFHTRFFAERGSILFRDRVQRHLRGQPLKDASRYVRELVRRRARVPAFLRGVAGVDAGALPWRPSRALLESPIFTGESNHLIDSSLLILSKSRMPQMARALYVLHERYRHELYANLHGDKEIYWLACELSGEGRCGVSGIAAGEIGQLLLDRRGKPCLMGNLLQFHPDDPRRVVHCNCKRHASWMYTHATLPSRFSTQLASMRADGLRNRSAELLVSEGANRGDEARLRVGLEGSLSHQYLSRQCVDAVEPIAQLLERLGVRGGASGQTACEAHGLLCPPPRWLKGNLSQLTQAQFERRSGIPAFEPDSFLAEILPNPNLPE